MAAGVSSSCGDYAAPRYSPGRSAILLSGSMGNTLPGHHDVTRLSEAVVALDGDSPWKRLRLVHDAFSDRFPLPRATRSDHARYAYHVPGMKYHELSLNSSSAPNRRSAAVRTSGRSSRDVTSTRAPTSPRHRELSGPAGLGEVDIAW